MVAQEIEHLRRDLQAEQQRGLRLLADFENVRRRMAREQAAAYEDGRRAALLPLLPVLDNLERAIANGSSDPLFYEGVAATRRQFVAALHEAGAEPVQTIGLPFDPASQEAVSTAPVNGVAPGTVVSEAGRGWRMGDVVPRPAQVVVASGESVEERSEPWP